MIVAPRGWRARRLEGGLLLHPVNGEPVVIVYRETVRPVADVRALVADELARDPGFQPVAVGAPEPLITHEGEHAALVTVAGGSDGRPAQRTFGFLLTDDYYASAVGVTTLPEHFDDLTRTVRELILTDSHMLGVRRRRFRCDAPVGWQAEALGLDTVWLAPGFALAPAAITVWPAWPVACAHDRLHALIATAAGSPAFDVQCKSGPRATSSRFGLRGSIWELDRTPLRGRKQRRLVALLQDDRYVYPLRLDAAVEEAIARDQAAFRDLVASVQPIPRPTGCSAVLASELFGHWAA